MLFSCAIVEQEQKGMNLFMRKQILRLVCLLGVISLCLGLCGCSFGTNQTAKKASKSGFYFDTIISITLYGTDDTSEIDACFALADTYEKKFSNTISDSEISQINAKAGTGEYVTVSPETLELLKAGIAYGDLSNGAFDITIGKLTSLWNFSEISENAQSDTNEVDESVLPDETAIATLLSHVNYQNIEIQENAVRLNDADAMIDLGGIAKGYVADKMRELLQKDGITQGIINLGGNVLTIGPKENGDDYVIGIQKPFAQANETLGAVSLSDGSVVTSGIYQRYYRVNGTLYHHILDTATGYPCETSLNAVTIISPSSTDGDALSTICYVLGKDKGLELIESLPDTEAIFVDTDNQTYVSSGFGETVTFTKE